MMSKRQLQSFDADAIILIYDKVIDFLIKCQNTAM